MDTLSVLSLFSGGGGLDMGAKIVGGFRTVAYIEIESYAQAVLMSNMRKGILDKAPIWDNIESFDGAAMRDAVDVLAGGFPCQDLSVAGKRVGIRGERSGLWFEYARLIREVRPRFVLVENVPGLAFSGGLGDVLGSLAALGYDADWWTLSAADVGAPHLRERIWIVAYAHGQYDKRRCQPRIADSEGGAPRPQSQGLRPNVAHAKSAECQRPGRTRKGRSGSPDRRTEIPNASRTGRIQDGPRQPWPETGWWAIKSLMGRTADGLAKECNGAR